jgi:hypothetical protein
VVSEELFRAQTGYSAGLAHACVESDLESSLLRMAFVLERQGFAVRLDWRHVYG